MSATIRKSLLATILLLLPGLALSATPPRNGITMAEVEQVSGTPKAKHDAVGQPPITRWDYDGFSVYFEYDRVLHTVQN